MASFPTLSSHFKQSPWKSHIKLPLTLQNSAFALWHDLEVREEENSINASQLSLMGETGRQGIASVSTIYSLRIAFTPPWPWLIWNLNLIWQRLSQSGMKPLFYLVQANNSSYFTFLPQRVLVGKIILLFTSTFQLIFCIHSLIIHIKLTS